MDPHGVVCRRVRKKGMVTGCGMGVCWACMASRPRAELGMVRTTREEFESLKEDAWWMHERCMEHADLKAYFGGEKELALARANADKAEASGDKGKAKEKDPADAQRELVQKMSVKELKAYLDRHGISHAECVEKQDLLAKALEAADSAPPEPSGPAWMANGAVCRLCTKPAKEFGGIICRRRRKDGRVAGCGESVCWRCMKRAPRESFGKVRCTKEEFESLEQEAWWMHEACFEDGDYKDYFGESEPEEDKAWRAQAFESWDGGEQPKEKLGSIIRRCEAS